MADGTEVSFFAFFTMVSWVIVPTFALVTLVNLFSARTIRPITGTQVAESVAVLLPLRNEADNCDSLISSLLAQEGLPNLSITALDDHSHDQTNEKLAAVSDPRFGYFDGAELPSEWLGKNFACHQLSQSTGADYLVFVDADVRLHPRAISSSIAAMKEFHWDYLSPYPRQIAITWLERLVQPLLQWSWFASVPLRFAERFPRPSMAVANGQFFIVRNEAYKKCGGHEVVKSEVLDDLELARALIRTGARGVVADGSRIAQCRMYESAREVIRGYSKSQWRAFGSIMGAILMIIVLLASSIVPVIAGTFGSPWGWIGFFTIVTTRLAVASKTHSVLSSSWLHPFSALAWITLIIFSWIQKSRGTLVWKERSL